MLNPEAMAQRCRPIAPHYDQGNVYKAFEKLNLVKFSQQWMSVWEPKNKPRGRSFKDFLEGRGTRGHRGQRTSPLLPHGSRQESSNCQKCHWVSTLLCWIAAEQAPWIEQVFSVQSRREGGGGWVFFLSRSGIGRYPTKKQCIKYFIPWKYRWSDVACNSTGLWVPFMLLHQILYLQITPIFFFSLTKPAWILDFSFGIDSLKDWLHISGQELEG